MALIQSQQDNFDVVEVKEPEVSYKMGQLLKSAREAKKISLEDACRSLKIRKFFLENIEKGDFEKLPGTVYTLGFIKSYSSYLGVDFEELSSELMKLTTSLEKEAPLTSYNLNQPKNLLTKTALWLSVLLTAACVGGYFLYFSENNVRLKRVEQREKTSESIREKIKPLPQVPGEKSLAVGADQMAQNSEAVTISANKETWIKIVDANNQLVVARLLRPHGFYRLNTEPGFRLTAGEAGALSIYLGDEKLIIPTLIGDDLLENLPIDRRSLDQYVVKPVVIETPQLEGAEAVQPNISLPSHEHKQNSLSTRARKEEVLSKSTPLNKTLNPTSQNPFKKEGL